MQRKKIAQNLFVRTKKKQRTEKKFEQMWNILNYTFLRRKIFLADIFPSQTVTMNAIAIRLSTHSPKKVKNISTIYTKYKSMKEIYNTKKNSSFVIWRKLSSIRNQLNNNV